MAVQTADHDAMGAMTTVHLPLPPRVPGCPCPEWMPQVDLSLHSYNKHVAMVRMPPPDAHCPHLQARARTHASTVAMKMTIHTTGFPMSIFSFSIHSAHH